jgi:hypothetical protein
MSWQVFPALVAGAAIGFYVNWCYWMSPLRFIRRGK